MPLSIPNFNPSIIDRAPTSLEPSMGGDDAELRHLRELTSRLAEELNATKSELAKLKGVSQVDSIKATLITPYANKVFWFVCVYTIFMAGVILLNGFKPGGFNLPEHVLIALTGSTALAVIGLIKIVVSGLFDVKK